MNRKISGSAYPLGLLLAPTWLLLVATALLFALRAPANARPAKKVPRVGFLVTTPVSPFGDRILAFRADRVIKDAPR
ncbi:MAG TPA: hypothetical protein VIB79_31280 [Candidatus Binatia bacterium]